MNKQNDLWSDTQDNNSEERTTGIQNYRSSDDEFIGNVLNNLRSEQLKHYVVSGESGFGKTSLLRRLADAADQNPETIRQYARVSFLEDYFSITNAEDFWISTLNALPDSSPQMIETHLITKVKNPTICTTKNAIGSTLSPLIDRLRLNNQRLLLLLDNLNLLLQRIDPDLSTFLDVLYTNPNIRVIGTCLPGTERVALNNQINNDLIEVYTLRKFSESECHATIKQLARNQRAYQLMPFFNEWPQRKKRLYALTNGNPRTTATIYNMISLGVDSDIRRKLEQTLDNTSPWYQARTESLSPNSRKVLDIIAINWDPINKNQIAKKLDLPLDIVSKELKSLDHILADSVN